MRCYIIRDRSLECRSTAPALLKFARLWLKTSFSIPAFAFRLCCMLRLVLIALMAHPAPCGRVRDWAVVMQLRVMTAAWQRRASRSSSMPTAFRRMSQCR